MPAIEEKETAFRLSLDPQMSIAETEEAVADYLRGGLQWDDKVTVCWGGQWFWSRVAGFGNGTIFAGVGGDSEGQHRGGTLKFFHLKHVKVGWV